MPPRDARYDQANGGVGYSVLVSQALKGPAGNPRSSDLVRGLGVDLGSAVPRSPIGRPVSNLVSLVLGASTPTEIAWPIVHSVPVDVTNFVDWRWLGSDEGLSNQDVSQHCRLLTFFADNHGRVAIRATEPEPLKRIVGRSAIGDPPVDESVVAGAVPRGPSDGLQMGHAQ